MKEKIEHTVLVLQLINAKGSTNILTKLGYDYAEIAKFLNFLRKSKYIEFTQEGLSLTEKGKLQLKKLNSNLNRKGIGKFISPAIEYKTEKLGIFDIYLPISKKRE